MGIAIIVIVLVIIVAVALSRKNTEEDKGRAALNAFKGFQSMVVSAMLKKFTPNELMDQRRMQIVFFFMGGAFISYCEKHGVSEEKLGPALLEFCEYKQNRASLLLNAMTNSSGPDAAIMGEGKVAAIEFAGGNSAAVEKVCRLMGR